jgi:hypothetical protein
MTISIYNAHQILFLQVRCPHRSLYLSMEASWYTCIHEIVVASWQLASVAWSVGQRTALESQGHRFSSGTWSCIFCFCTWLSLINRYKFPLNNFHLQYLWLPCLPLTFISGNIYFRSCDNRTREDFLFGEGVWAINMDAIYLY